MHANSPAASNELQTTRLWTMLALVIVTAIGFHLRVQTVHQTQTPNPIIADARDYFAYAFNLRHHGVYSRSVETFTNPSARPEPDALRSPGYPAFLSLFMGKPVDQSTLKHIKWAQALLSTLAILGTFFLARLFLPTIGALGAALLTALSPHLVNVNLYLLTESLFAFLAVVGAWALGRALQSHRRAYLLWAVCGLLLAAGSLVRPSLQYFIVVAVLLAVASLGTRRGLKASVVAGAIFAVAMGAWSARNYAVIGELSDDTLKISAIHHGLYPGFRYQDDPKTYGYPYRYDPRSPEISRSVSAALTEVRRRFAEEPLRHLGWYLFGKPVALWSWNIVQGAGDAFVYPVEQSPYQDNPLFRSSHALMRWAHWPLVVLGALGSLAVWVPAVGRRLPPDQRVTAKAVSAILLYFTLIHMIVQPFPRYSIPLRPLLYCAAILGLTLLIPGRHRGRDSALQPPPGGRRQG